MFGNRVYFRLSVDKPKVTSNLGGIASILFILIIIYYTTTEIIEVANNNFTIFTTSFKLLDFNKEKVLLADVNESFTVFLGCTN